MSISVTIIHFRNTIFFMNKSNINNKNYDNIQKICQEMA